MSCLNPGDEIIVPEPAYANYMAFAISAGAVIRPVVVDRERIALPPIEEFEKLINERTRGILICNPNNPTGYPLYAPRDGPHPRHGSEIRPVPLLRRGLPRIHLHRFALHFGLPPRRHRTERRADDSVSKRYSECGIRIGR